MTKNAVDLVRDAVANLNKIELKVQDATRLLAAGCMVFYSEAGGNKKARELLAPMLHDVTGEGTAGAILAWVGKCLARYEVEIKAAMPEGATAARDAVLKLFGDRPWNKIRSEHRPEKAENPTPPPARAPVDGPLKKIDDAPAPEAPAVARREAILALVRDLTADELAPIVDALSGLLSDKIDAERGAEAKAA